MTATEVRRPPRLPGPPAPRPPSARTPSARTPLLAALLVVLLWGAWLLVPPQTRLHLLGGAASGAATAGDAPAAGTAPYPAAREEALSAPGAGDADGPDPAEGDPAGGDPAAGADDPAAVDPAEPDPAEPDPAVPDLVAAGPVPVPKAGDGTFAVAPGTGPVVGTGDRVRYTVEVEGGVPLDPAQVATVVERVLGDPRSWTARGRWSLERVDSEPDARIIVASPDTADRLCAPLRTRGELSCRNGDDVVLNANRWTLGARSWGDDVAGYQEYLVNHELGHFLGNGHVPCPQEGEPAPVMLQQTLGLAGCLANAWPHP